MEKARTKNVAIFIFTAISISVLVFGIHSNLILIGFHWNHDILLRNCAVSYQYGIDSIQLNGESVSKSQKITTHSYWIIRKTYYLSIPENSLKIQSFLAPLPFTCVCMWSPPINICLYLQFAATFMAMNESYIYEKLRCMR